MSSKLDRLRKLHGVRPKRKRAEPDVPKGRPTPRDTDEPIVYVDIEEPSPSRAPDTPFDYTASVEEVVPGREIENESGVCYLAATAYALSDLRGPNPLEDLLVEQPQLFDARYPKFNLSTTTDFRKTAFIDIETTGLGIGAGVYCFMIGVGTFEHFVDGAKFAATPNLDEPPTHFVVRQFFMRGPEEETAQLVAVSDALASCDMTVTFNGRTFDLPMMRARYRQNRYALPPAYETCALLDESNPHLDLLLPARRLWRRRLGSCRLINLEEKILGRSRSATDVPGHLIPMLFAEYMRSGEAGAMPGIFYHNCEDIVSMVGLAERLCRAYAADPSGRVNSVEQAQDPGVKDSKRTGDSQSSTGVTEQNIAEELHGLEWLALGESHERTGEVTQAEVAFRRSITLLAVDESGEFVLYRAEAFRRLGLLQKRQDRWAEAVETWQLWLSSVSDIDPTPYIELAKYFEWRDVDLDQAEMWASWALHNLQRADRRSTLRRQIPEIEHRLARIKRKKLDKKN